MTKHFLPFSHFVCVFFLSFFNIVSSFEAVLFVVSYISGIKETKFEQKFFCQTVLATKKTNLSWTLRIKRQKKRATKSEKSVRFFFELSVKEIFVFWVAQNSLPQNFLLKFSFPNTRIGTGDFWIRFSKKKSYKK